MIVPPVRTLAALVAALVLALAAAPSQARAASGPCFPGSPALCQFQTGKVTFVADGDTIDVDIAGDGTKTPRPIRLTGINAMEQTRYSKYAARRRGACHALAATARIESLLRKGRMKVRLAAQNPASHSRQRLRRQVSARIGGQWVDVGALLVAEGHALWMANPVEWAWNNTYRVLAERAAAAGLRLWNPTSCGAGPAADAGLRVEVQYDAPHDDATNLNGEWLRIVNPSGSAVALGGWWVRDSALRQYALPAATVVPAGGAVTVHAGSGFGTATDLYWGLSAPIFENPTYDARGMGDGGYLFDPQGDLRAWAIYPS